MTVWYIDFDYALDALDAVDEAGGLVWPAPVPLGRCVNCGDLLTQDASGTTVHPDPQYAVFDRRLAGPQSCQSARGSRPAGRLAERAGA